MLWHYWFRLIVSCYFVNFWNFISLYRATTADVDYLENQCAENPIGQASCDYQEYENQDIGFPDLQVTVANKEEVWYILQQSGIYFSLLDLKF